MNKTAERFIDAVSRYKSIVIYIPGSPDPDAIASAYAIKEILKVLSIDSDIYAEKGLSLKQNRAFIERLKIPVIFNKAINLKKYEAYIIPDFQNNRVESIGDTIPCAAHFDHHSKADNTVKADFSLVRTDAGSTSTLVALVIKHSGIAFPDKKMARIATALTFGIETDTDKYKKMTSLDLEALNYLSFYAEKKILESISSIPPSSRTLHYYEKAKENIIIYRDWSFHGLGYIEARNRDSLAMAADMILASTDHKVVAVFAVIEDNKKGELYLDVSLRSKSSNVDLNRLIKRITPNGGGRKYKGAYQVKLNYFSTTPDREMLWELVEETTLETLRRSRDTYYITGLESIVSNFKSKVLSVFKKEEASG